MLESSQAARQGGDLSENSTDACHAEAVKNVQVPRELANVCRVAANVLHALAKVSNRKKAERTFGMISRNTRAHLATTHCEIFPGCGKGLRKP